jgi:NADH:ubiquinone oxidoreductase subunit 5 (subunit L)/multisubunit Na+/H+ antiporter MnhA subunit
LTKSISAGLACAAMIASFAVSALLVSQISASRRRRSSHAVEWMASGTLRVPFTLRLDHLSR